jgi:hypothetical protein
MSVSATALRSQATAGWSLADIRVVRYALGATVATAIALGSPWETSYLTPVLVATFLANPDKPLSPRLGAVLIVVVAVAIWFGWQVGQLVKYPAVFLLFASLVLFWIFHAGQRGRSALVLLWLVIAVMMIPFARMVYPAAAVFVARGLVVDVVLTATIVVAAYGLLPERPTDGGAPSGGDASAAAASPDASFRAALVATVVVVPLMALFYFFELSGALTVLAYVGILSAMPDIGTDVQKGRERIRGNIVGGGVAIVVYNLLLIVPSFSVLLLLTLLAGLALGSRAFARAAPDPFFVTAYSTTLLIIGATAFRGEASSEVYLRILQITIAVTYVVVGFEFVNRLLPARR